MFYYLNSFVANLIGYKNEFCLDFVYMLIDHQSTCHYNFFATSWMSSIVLTHLTVITGSFIRDKLRPTKDWIIKILLIINDIRLESNKNTMVFAIEKDE
jgi:hypothetical protein